VNAFYPWLQLEFHFFRKQKRVAPPYRFHPRFAQFEDGTSLSFNPSFSCPNKTSLSGKKYSPGYQSACDFARLVLDGFSERDVAIAMAR
jgi:hypothetical protein